MEMISSVGVEEKMMLKHPDGIRTRPGSPDRVDWCQNPNHWKRWSQTHWKWANEMLRFSGAILKRQWRFLRGWSATPWGLFWALQKGKWKQRCHISSVFLFVAGFAVENATFRLEIDTQRHTHTRVPTREKRNEKTRHSIGVYQCVSMSKGNYSLSIWKSRSIVIALSDRNFPRIPLKKSVMASPKNMTANSLRLGTSQMRRANCKESTNNLRSIWIDLTDLCKHPKRNMGESWLNL